MFQPLVATDKQEKEVWVRSPRFYTELGRYVWYCAIMQSYRIFRHSIWRLCFLLNDGIVKWVIKINLMQIWILKSRTIEWLTQQKNLSMIFIFLIGNQILAHVWRALYLPPPRPAHTWMTHGAQIGEVIARSHALCKYWIIEQLISKTVYYTSFQSL